MGSGARRAGAAVALVAALLALTDSAPAQTRRASAARQAQRASASATQEAQRAQAQARRAEREIAALEQRLEDAAARRAEAETAAQESEERLQDLAQRRALVGSAYQRDQAAMEAVLSACLFADHGRRGGGRERAFREAFLRAASGDVAVQAVARRREILETDAQLAAEASARTALIETQAVIDDERQGLQALKEQQNRSRAELLADARAAERRAARYAREARSLGELARRVQSQPRRQAAAGTAPTAPLGPLSQPVQGRLAVSYGQQTEAGRPSPGLVWRTAAGASVTAPAAGSVGYAGPFRSYGHILILNLENGYSVVLAGMGETRVRAGERVTRGQLVGLMKQEAAPAPELYVEIRRNGLPIDPSTRFAARGPAPADGRAG